jgi:hypothetical protein
VHSVKVFQVADIVGPNEKGSVAGREFTWTPPAGPGLSRADGSWWSNPLGIAARSTDWIFAWAMQQKLEILSGVPGKPLHPKRTLFVGAPNVYRIEFSPAGRFVFAQSFQGFGSISARVWDLADLQGEPVSKTQNWATLVSEADIPSLRRLVCHVAGIEGPQGDQLTADEQSTWDITTQPCPSR